MRRPVKNLLIAAAGVYAVAAVALTPKIRHGWWYLQENALRRHGDFVRLCAASAAFPWCAADAVRAYRRLATRGVPEPALPTALVAAVPGAGASAVRVDARTLTRGRFRTLLEDYAALHGGCRVWCTGLFDYVLTPEGPVDAGALLALFGDGDAFERFAAARIYSPEELLASYVGSFREVEPAFADAPRQGALRAALAAPRTLFAPAPKGAGGPVRASALTPLAAPGFGWIVRGEVEPDVFAAFTNRLAVVQAARRDVLRGHDLAAAGQPTNAVAHWARAARENPHDPLLGALADALDREGALHVQLGNLGGAMRCYENRAEIFPDDVSAIHNFGLCLKNAGHPELAAQVFLKCVTMDPLLDAHRLELVECAAASDREDLAVRHLDVLIKRHPENEDYARRRVRILLHRHLKEQDAFNGRPAAAKRGADKAKGRK